MQTDPKTGSTSTNFRAHSSGNPDAWARSNNHLQGAEAKLDHPRPFYPQTFSSSSQARGGHQITPQMGRFEHSSAPMSNPSYPYRPPTSSQHEFGGYGPIRRAGHSTPPWDFGSMQGHDHGSMKRTANPQFQHSGPLRFDPYGNGFGHGHGSGSSLPRALPQWLVSPQPYRHRPKNRTDLSLFRSQNWPLGPVGPWFLRPEPSQARPVFRDITIQGRDELMPELGLSGKQMLEDDNHPLDHSEEGMVRCSPTLELNLTKGLMEPKLGIGDDKPSSLSSDQTKTDPYMRDLPRDENGDEEVNSGGLDLTLRL